jgi:predicted SAM-dependent methyltransferase
MNTLNLIVGAGGTVQSGWRSLEASQLDIRDFRQWERLFSQESIDSVLCEHVLEHLDWSGLQATVRNFYYFLRRGGYVRVAVPDGFNRSANYLNWVSPGSPGESWLNLFRGPLEPPHKVLFNYQVLSRLFSSVGFVVVLREWHDEHGHFHKGEWSAKHGAIKRCAGSFHSSLLSVIVGAPYTSLILDAVKLRGELWVRQ